MAAARKNIDLWNIINATEFHEWLSAKTVNFTNYDTIYELEDILTEGYKIKINNISIRYTDRLPNGTHISPDGKGEILINFNILFDDISILDNNCHIIMHRSIGENSQFHLSFDSDPGTKKQKSDFLDLQFTKKGSDIETIVKNKEQISEFLDRHIKVKSVMKDKKKDEEDEEDDDGWTTVETKKKTPIQIIYQIFIEKIPVLFSKIINTYLKDKILELKESIKTTREKLTVAQTNLEKNTKTNKFGAKSYNMKYKNDVEKLEKEIIELNKNLNKLIQSYRKKYLKYKAKYLKLKKQLEK
jgi:hypothetical protein